MIKNNYKKFISKYIDTLITLGFAEKNKIKGLEEDDLSSYEERSNIRFPEIIREFLLAM